MKKLSKVLAVCLALTLLVTLFAACGGSYSFKAEDAIDSSSNQQRWLKYPNSAITINPSAVNGEDSTDTAAQELSLGIGNKTLDDVLFTLEKASANGASGSVEWEADFSAETTKFTNLKNLEANNSTGSALNVVVPNEYRGKPLDSYSTFTIGGDREAYQYDFANKEYFLVIESGECAELVDINFYTFSPVYDKLLAAIGSNETIVVSINDLCAQIDPELVTDSTRAFFNIHFKKGGAYQFKTFAVKVMPGGVQSATEAALVYAPYSLKNTATYPNGTVVEAEDFFYSENTITRKLTTVAPGGYKVGGKIADGATAKYNEKDSAVEVNGANGINYSVRLGAKDDVKFYANEEDMLSGKNPLETASGAKYWTATIPNASEGDAVYVAVALSESEAASELTSAAKNGTSASRARKRLSNLPDEWTEYISTHGDVANYIKNIPESK